MATKTKRHIFAPVLCCFTLVLALLPVPALAEGTVYQVTANIAGGDIYVYDESQEKSIFSNMVTVRDNPLTTETEAETIEVEATSIGAITVTLPGYTTSYVRNEDDNTIDATLTPELYPEKYEGKVETLTVGGGTYPTLAAALNAATNSDPDKWYLIEFADGVTTDYSGELTIDDSYLNLTINGGGDVALSADTSLRVYGSDIRIVDLQFAERTTNDMALQMKVPDNDNSKPYHMDNIYVLGCSFDTAFEVGVATCGERGYAATEYGGDGTANFNNLVFAGNTFIKTKLFSFAGAGDEDYNVIDGYRVCGNTFVDCGVGMLAGDAHTWYVYGYDGQQSPAYCEYNILRSVLVSGNSFTMTAEAVYEYMNIIGLGCANLGNSHNLFENVEVRNNISRILGGEANMFSSVSMGNVSVSDNYNEEGSEMEGYAQYVDAGMEHTDYNITRNVRIHHNDFQLGAGGAMHIHNTETNVGKQCGKRNVMEDVEIDHNDIEAQSGVKIANYSGNHLSGECSGNDTQNVRFHHNTVICRAQALNETGILVAGSGMSNHGQEAAAYPEYAGVMSDIDVSHNTVSGYKYGVVVAGSAGDYGVGLGVSDVTVTGNTITTALYNDYMEHDFGVVVAGSCLQTNGEYNNSGSPLQPSNISCFARNVTVTGNTISAQGGIAVSGNLVSSAGLGNPAGNYVSGVTISGNEIAHRPQSVNPARLPAIIVTSALDPWNKMQGAGEIVDLAEYFAGCFAENVTVGTNLSTGFEAANIALPGVQAPEGWDDIGKGLYSRSLRGTTDLDRAYYLPVLGLTHVTVKRTGLAGCTAAISALYNENGKMLQVAMSGEWGEKDFLTLALPRTAATAGKTFFLTTTHTPASPTQHFTP